MTQAEAHHDICVLDEHGQRLAKRRLPEGVISRSPSRRGGWVASRGRTTIQDPRAVPAGDLVRRDFTAPAPDQKWVADITSVRCDEGWLYLAVVMDVFSQKMVGWSMRSDLGAEIVSDALAMAVARRRPPVGVIQAVDLLKATC